MKSDCASYGYEKSYHDLTSLNQFLHIILYVHRVTSDFQVIAVGMVTSLIQMNWLFLLCNVLILSNGNHQ